MRLDQPGNRLLSGAKSSANSRADLIEDDILPSVRSLCRIYLNTMQPDDCFGRVKNGRRR